MTLYQILYDSIHAKSGQGSTLKLQYIRTERECVMGWVRLRPFVGLHPFSADKRHAIQITQPFELYLALSPRLPKTAAIGAANSIARWIQKEEKRLFLRDAPVF